MKGRNREARAPKLATTLSITTFSITTLSIMKFGIMALSITIKR
jgi:hypothetical protein